MKKSKGLLILLAVSIIISSFVACSSKPKYEDKVVTVTQAVTDEQGEVVTDKYGEVVVEAVTDENGEAVTMVVDQTTSQTQNNQTHQNTSKITSVNNKNTEGKTSQKSTNKKEKTTNGEKTTAKKPSKKPSKTTTTTTTTTLPPTTAVGDKDIDEKDYNVCVILPFFSPDDANKYDLLVKIGNKTLTYKINDGARGQKIYITIPKEYKGKKANFSMVVNSKEYSVDGTIKKDLKVEFETIIVIEGEDD